MDNARLDALKLLDEGDFRPPASLIVDGLLGEDGLSERPLNQREGGVRGRDVGGIAFRKGASAADTKKSDTCTSHRKAAGDFRTDLMYPFDPAFESSKGLCDRVREGGMRDASGLFVLLGVFLRVRLVSLLVLLWQLSKWRREEMHAKQHHDKDFPGSTALPSRRYSF